MISPSMQASRPLFAIVISEKGGAERREAFDRPELSVGRVQGNDLMLPKGNVSKRHARLVFRDGRFIVSDLNSTNGTYVNRRRISQATIVREGDRIYIGDFVLRIELPEGASIPDSEVSDASAADAPNSAVSGDAPADSSRPTDTSGQRGKLYPEVPRAPKVPNASRPSVQPGEPLVTPSQVAPVPQITRAAVEPVSSERANAQERVSLFTDETSGAEAKAHRAALAAIVGNVLDDVDASLLDDPDDATVATVERLVRERVQELEAQGHMPRNLTAHRLAADARAELLDTGPLQPLLDDADVSQIVVTRFDRVEARRAGAFNVVMPSFTSEAAFQRAIRRLLRQAGMNEPSGAVETRLPTGALVSVVAGAAARSGAVLVIRKPRDASTTLEQLVRSGSISRAMATFLQQAVMARLNLLIVGAREANVSPLITALCSVSNDRLIVSHELDVLSGQRGAVELNLHQSAAALDRLLQVAMRVPESRLVVSLRSPQLTTAVLEAVSERSAGLLAQVSAPNLRRAVSRLSAEVAAERAGTPVAVAREWLCGTFDLAIEVVRLRDGRERVLRVTELVPGGTEELQLNDVFAFVVDRTAAGGAIEGSFVATGYVPKAAEDMTSRGYSVDASLFTRAAPSR